jgi:hypothetical protein
MPASLVLSRRIVSTPPSNGPLRVALFAVLLACVCCNVARAADMHKVLRIASSDITSLDPQQGTDL